MGKLIELKNLNLRYKSNTNETLKDISLSIEEKTITSIVGRSGSGKTTLVNFLLGLNFDLTEFSYKDFKINNNEKKDFTELYGNFYSMILQNATGSLNPTTKIYNQFKIAFKGVNKKIKKNELIEQCEKLLNQVGLNCELVLNKYPAELSGGMNQRIAIALALVKMPKMLIFDEPTSSIDEQNKDQLLNLLKQLREKNNLTIIVITHDFEFAIKLADNLIVMENGCIVENTQINNNQYLLKSSNAKKLLKDSKLEKQKNNYNKGETLVKFENVSKEFKNSYIFKNVNFVIYKNNCFGIVGESGSGKSTICKIISGIYKQTDGIVFIKPNIKIEYIYQDVNSSLNPKLKVYKLLNEYNYINHQKMFPKDLILKYFSDFNLPEDILYKNINQLSGGQKQLILIIRSLLVKPDLIILDEPTSSLDVTTQKNLLSLLKKIKTKYDLTYILISHNIEVIKYMCANKDIYKLSASDN